MHDRPKIKLPKTLFELVLDGLTLLLFFISIGYLIKVWAILPAEVPAHYNAVGEVDRWGSKWEMLILPLLSVVMWIGMTVLEKYPHVYNYMNLTKDNVRAQYVNARLMLNVLKNIMVLLFAYIMWNDIQVALGNAESLGQYFVFIFLAALFIPMIYFIVRSLRL